jgi:hypothetical protein
MRESSEITSDINHEKKGVCLPREGKERNKLPYLTILSLPRPSNSSSIMSAADVDAVDFGVEEDELLDDDAAMEEDEPVAPKVKSAVTGE